MTRYRTYFRKSSTASHKAKPKAYYVSDMDEYGEASMTADEVIWDEDFAEADEEETGVLDQHGNMIYRELDRVPFGFHNRED